MLNFNYLALSSFQFTTEEALVNYKDWVRDQAGEVQKIVGLIVVDALRKEGKGTVQACRQTESLVGISERSLRKWRKSYYARGEIAISKRGGSQKYPLLIDENLKESY